MVTYVRLAPKTTSAVLVAPVGTGVLETFPTHIIRPFLKAYEVALLSTHKFRHGAALFKNKIVVAKPNLVKTHPWLKQFCRFPYLHAESNAILSKGVDNCDGFSMVVVRLFKSGELAYSKPCLPCQNLCAKVGLHMIYHT